VSRHVHCRCFETIQIRANQATTNNAVESFHASLRRRLGVSSSTPKFICFSLTSTVNNIDIQSDVSRITSGLPIRRASQTPTTTTTRKMWMTAHSRKLMLSTRVTPPVQCTTAKPILCQPTQATPAVRFVSWHRVRAGSWSLRALRHESDCGSLVVVDIFAILTLF